jgi:hypothetical protein
MSFWGEKSTGLNCAEPAAFAREGALNNLSPALGAGKRGRTRFVAAKAAITKGSRGARIM